MEHYYKNIENWFTYPILYKKMVEKFDNAKFVEIGNWKGASVVYMGVEIYNSGKNIKLDCIDNMHESIFKILNDNIKPELKPFINTHNINSIEGSKLYDDQSIDFVFIDGSHEYQDIKDDPYYWFPKVKNGGVFAGHDYPAFEGVQKAVDEFFYNKNFEKSEMCWIYYK